MAKRRGNEEGTIYKRTNGKWQAQVSLSGNRISKTFGTQSESRSWVRDILTQKSDGLSSMGAKLTFGEYLEQWLEDVRSSLKSGTWFQYRGIVQNHVLQRLGDTKLIELTPRHIQDLYTLKLQQGTGKRTVEMIHAVIHRSLVMAHRQGLVSSIAAKAVQKPKSSPREMKVLSENQIKNLLLMAERSKMGAQVRLAITTGLRLGELLGLKWVDVDWTGSKLQVRRQLQRLPHTGLVFSSPKTKSGRRTVKIGSSTLSILGKHLDSQDDQKARVGVRWEDNDLIFPTTRGTPKEPRNYIREFKALLKKAELPNIRFHDLRHTAASLMLLSNMPLISISRQLGHAKPSTTLDIYGHLIPGLETDSAEKLDQIVNPIAAELQQIGSVSL